METSPVTSTQLVALSRNPRSSSGAIESFTKLAICTPSPIAVVHQPHFFPWLGYFNKLVSADIFIIQDNVQFRRGYYQNRTIIRNSQGHPHWLTIPIHAHRTTLIRDVVVASQKWADQARKSLRHAYAKAPNFAENFEIVATALDNNDKYLVDINERTIALVLRVLGVPVEIKRASDLTHGENRTSEVVSACEKVGARGYIYGEGGGMQCHPPQAFTERGIPTYRQNFRDCFLKSTLACGLTAPNVSVLEFLFRFGSSTTRWFTEHCWKVENKC